MATKKGGLGKGLDSLISFSDEVELNSASSSEQKNAQEVVKEVVKEVKVYEQQFIKLREIEPNKNQPRKEFDEAALEELEESIRQYGILQPLIVKRKDNHYEIVAGERRWRAAKLAGLKEVPVIVKELTDQEVSEISLIENIQREELNPVEEAMAYQRLIQEYGLRQEDIAKRVGKARASITNSMRLLKLAPAVQNMLISGVLSTGHAKVLLAVEDLEKQSDIARTVEENQLSVRETEVLVKNILNPKKPKEKISLDYQELYQELQEKLMSRMGTKVEIKRKSNKAGKIEISYFSNDELERILGLIGVVE